MRISPGHEGLQGVALGFGITFAPDILIQIDLLTWLDFVRIHQSAVWFVCDVSDEQTRRASHWPTRHRFLAESL